MNPPTPSAKDKNAGGLDAKYGQVTIEQGTPFLPGEPVLVLRGKDAAAIRAIARYRQDLATVEDETKRPSAEFLAGLDKVISTFSEWQVANAEHVRLPD